MLTVARYKERKMSDDSDFILSNKNQMLKYEAIKTHNPQEKVSRTKKKTAHEIIVTVFFSYFQLKKECIVVVFSFLLLSLHKISKKLIKRKLFSFPIIF